jgi:multiple sugar transport system ATP-binding protein
VDTCVARLALQNVNKVFGKQHVVKDLSLEVDDGEFVVFLGPSGCGKSTTLRMIAGLDDISSGSIYIGDTRVNDVEAKDRNLAMVFQSYALYPHMTVFDNIAFALVIAGLPRKQIEAKVNAVAELLQLGELLKRKPAQLSGGQRQRVAMGRAMVREPQLFLFDEPLSNLDTKLRAKMRDELKQIHERMRTTTVYVTHDQIEAMTLAHKIVIMRHGVIEQVGSPTEVFLAPRNTFVAGFIGSPTMNMVEMAVTQQGGHPVVTRGEIRVPLPQRYAGATAAKDKVLVGFRPTDIALAGTATASTSDGATIRATVQSLEIHGAEVLVRAKAADFDFNLQVPLSMRPQLGETFSSVLDLKAMHVFDTASGMALV